MNSHRVSLGTVCLALAAGSATAQTCDSLDVVPDGSLTLTDFSNMQTFTLIGAESPGDFDQDGVTDWLDFAFFLANYDSCRTGGTITPLEPVQEILTIVTKRVANAAAAAEGLVLYEVLWLPDDVNDRFVIATDFNPGGGDCGAPPCFIEPAGFVDSLLPMPQQAPFDTYFTIGSRSGSGLPTPFVLFPDQAAADRLMPAFWFTLSGFQDAGALASTPENADGVLLASIVLPESTTGLGEISVIIRSGDVLKQHTESLLLSDDTALFADVNNDGIRNGADFNAWLAAFAARRGVADQNQDGVFDGSDINAWLSNFSSNL